MNNALTYLNILPRPASSPPVNWMLALCLMAVAGCSSRIEQAISHFSVQTPRPFGYMIGDEIEQHIELEVRKGFSLQYGSLPEKGGINRWLTLKHVDVEQKASGGNVRYRIELRYQIFHAPLEVKMLSLPEFRLLFRQGVNQVEQSVPAWHFTVSPIRELAIRKENGKLYMRPDAPAPFIDTGPQQLILLASLSIAAFAALYLAFLHGLLPRFSERRIFLKAMRQSARIDNRHPHKLFKILHDALNELNQAILYKHQLDAFYRRHPGFGILRAELDWFFDASNRFHFAEGAQIAPDTADKLRKLCRQCRAIETGAR